jgi:uncharacterized protein YbcI
VRGTKQLREPGPVTMKTQGDIEAAVCEGVSRFEQEFMGRGPKDIRAHLIGDLLVGRLQGVLTDAEQHLVKTLPVEKGRDLLKQVRTQLIETARPLVEAMIQEVTGTSVATRPSLAACTPRHCGILTFAHDGKRSCSYSFLSLWNAECIRWA